MTTAVVIAWVNDFELLEPGLRALFTQTSPPSEIIIATRHSSPVADRLSRAFPEIQLLRAPAHTTIPELRAMGITATRGDIVLVTEDHCVPTSDWISRAQTAISAGSDIASGPVENACSARLRDSAAFLTEYSGVMRPEAPGVTNGIPGNNVAYRCDIALEIARTLSSGMWESFAIEQLQQRGVRITFDPDMIVHHRRPFGIRYFLAQRFHFCRAFAAMRSRSLPAAGRVMYALGSLLLPPLLFFRSLRNLLERRRLTRDFLTGSPLIFSYFCAGALGEMLGYFFDGSGSLRYVE